MESQSLLHRRIFGVPLLNVLLISVTVIISALIGLDQRALTLILVAVAGTFVMLFLIKHPLVGVGLASTLLVTGGLSEMFSNSWLQRLYSISLVLTFLAYFDILYNDRALLRDWLRIRLSDIFFAALFVSAILSIGVAEDEKEAWRELKNLLRYFAIYFLITRSIRTVDDMIFVGKFLLVGAIWQVSTTWSDSATRVADSNGVERVSGSLRSLNAFAASQLMALPWAFYFAWFGTPIWRILGIMGAALLPYTLLGAVSRTSVVVLLLQGLGWPLLAVRRVTRKLVLLVPVLLVCVVALSFRWDAIVARWSLLANLSNDSPVEYVVDDDGGREELKAMAMEIFKENWLFGVGIGNTPEYIGRERNTFTPFHVHNSYFEVAADLGLFGLMPFLGLFVGALLCPLAALRHAQNDRERAVLATAISMIVVLLIYSYSGNRHYHNASYLLVAYGYTAAYVVSQAATKLARQRSAYEEFRLHSLR